MANSNGVSVNCFHKQTMNDDAHFDYHPGNDQRSAAEPEVVGPASLRDDNIINRLGGPGRGRTASTSSSISSVDSGHVSSEMDRSNRKKKNKRSKARKPSSTCQTPGCNSDLTDSEGTLICYPCLKRVPENEFLPYPFHHFKRSWFPNWLHDPEYTCYIPKSHQPNDKGPERSCHRHTDSMFSTSSGFKDFRGLLNLALILLVLSTSRLFIENLMKYGVLVDPWETVLGCMLMDRSEWPNLMVVLFQGVHIIVAYFTEKLLSWGKMPETLGKIINLTNGFVQLTFPAAYVLWKHPNPMLSAFALSIVTITFLKLYSYTDTNYWCRVHKQSPPEFRRKRRQSVNENDLRENNSNDSDASSDSAVPAVKAPIVEYPNNLNMKDLLYFIAAPTLCYELNFPRSGRIRKRFLIKRILEMSFLFMVAGGLVQQWIVPGINNSIKPLSEMDYFKLVERLLKLAIPNHFIWLICFYAFFHSMLNVVAEVLKFGDRDFYHDWWNAYSIKQFWSKWNIPVHRWARRHVYIPLLEKKWNPMTTSMLVFAISAFFHEYLVSVPLRMFKYWAFLGMISQVPLAMLTEIEMFHGKVGNIVVWLSLILGQPIAILAYVHDYYITHVVGPADTNSTLKAAIDSATQMAVNLSAAMAASINTGAAETLTGLRTEL